MVLSSRPTHIWMPSQKFVAWHSGAVGPAWEYHPEGTWWFQVSGCYLPECQNTYLQLGFKACMVLDFFWWAPFSLPSWEIERALQLIGKPHATTYQLQGPLNHAWRGERSTADGHCLGLGLGFPPPHWQLANIKKSLGNQGIPLPPHGGWEIW